MKNRILCKMVSGVIVLTAIALSTAAQAQNKVESRLDKLEKENQILTSEIEALKKSPAASTPTEFTKEDKDTLGFLKAIQKRVQPFGEMGFRYHGLFYMSNLQTRGMDFSAADTNLSRADARVRLGLKGEVVDHLKYLVRLSTGEGNKPTSAWQTMDGFFKKNDINLDRYYLDWNPAFFPVLHGVLGKMDNQIKGAQLVWDNDVGINGVFVELDAAKAMDQKAIKKLALGGLFYYLEDYTGDAQDDTFIAGATFGSTFGLGEAVDLTVNLTYYDYHNVDGLAQGIASGAIQTAQGGTFTSNLTPVGPVNVGAATASTLTNLGFASDFNLINPYLELATKVGKTPAKMFFDFVYNAGAEGLGKNNEFGYIVGAKVGGTGEQFSPWIGYQFFWIQADATLDAFNEDQLGTNSTGHFFDAGITLAKNVDLYTTMVFSRDIAPDLRGFGDTLGTQIPGFAVPIDDTPWLVRPRLHLSVKF